MLQFVFMDWEQFAVTMYGRRGWCGCRAAGVWGVVLRRQSAGRAECLESHSPGCGQAGQPPPLAGIGLGQEGSSEQGKPFLPEPCTCAIVPANNGGGGSAGADDTNPRAGAAGGCSREALSAATATAWVPARASDSLRGGLSPVQC